MLRKILDMQGKLFRKGGKLEKLYPLYEAGDTFLYTPGEKTRGGAHVRDALDLKRMMITVVVALVPCTLMAMYNTGYQAQAALASLGLAPDAASERLPYWVGVLFQVFGLQPAAVSTDQISPLAIWLHGIGLFIPMYIVSMAVGGILEAIFCVIRGHEITEGFLVTGLLYPLVLPPDLPWWMAALGIAFGVVLGKEVFGGTGMNILNPALTARAFVFFAYPVQMSGDKVWIGLVDGHTAATPLGVASAEGHTAIQQALGAESLNDAWWSAFLGNIPGSMGETSTLACLIGAAILIVTGVGSWRIMLACLLGMIGMATLLNQFESPTNPFLQMPWHWHLVLGGFAFGTVFMATDPVSAANTNPARWIYGFMIGALCVLVRVLNPAYPEGMMLAILFMNIFAPLLDYFVIQANVRRREVRLGLQ